MSKWPPNVSTLGKGAPAYHHKASWGGFFRVAYGFAQDTRNPLRAPPAKLEANGGDGGVRGASCLSHNNVELYGALWGEIPPAHFLLPPQVPLAEKPFALENGPPFGNSKSSPLVPIRSFRFKFRLCPDSPSLINIDYDVYYRLTTERICIIVIRFRNPPFKLRFSYFDKRNIPPLCNSLLKYTFPTFV